MPSTNQSGKTTGDYDSIVSESDRDDDHFADAVKMVTTKNDATIKALIAGIRDPDRARAYIQAEVAAADYEDRDLRRRLIGMCNRKIDDLTPDEDGTTLTYDEDEAPA